MGHTRRHFFKFGGRASGLFAISRKGLGATSKRTKDLITTNDHRAEAEQLTKTFEYGVASGDPEAHRVIIWTRISGTQESHTAVDWQVANDIEFTSIVASGRTETSADLDYTVKVDAELPNAGTTYYYRFRAHGIWSMIGRTKTAPAVTDQVRLVIASCSSIWSGYFNSYRIISQMNDIDAVVHLGDYTYNEPDPDELRNMPRNPLNAVNPDSLETIRQRYRYYRKDPFLQRAHQQHPWVIVWDNHDIENHATKADNVRAFHEWVPIRSPEPSNHNIIYRRLKFGNLLDLVMLDTRHIGRGSKSDATGDISLLGDVQFDWLKEQLTESKSTWRVLGNQVLMAPWQIAGKILSLVNWDGYPNERRRLLEHLRDIGIQNTLVATGDAHLSFAANLDVDGAPVAVEFLPTSITRGNLDEQVKGALESIAAKAFETATRVFNPHVKYFESRSHGFGLINLTVDAATLEFWYVPHEELSNQRVLGHSVVVASGAQQISGVEKLATSGRLFGQQAPSANCLYQFDAELGGSGGSYFDDTEALPLTARLSKVGLRSGARVDSISLCYQDGPTLTHGGMGGTSQVLELAPDEYVRRVIAAAGKHKKTISVHYLRIETSHGQVIEGGVSTTHIIEFVAPTGYHIAGFRGRSGDELDKIGAIFAPDFTAT